MWLDRFGQRLRIDAVRPHIPAASKVLDIGCGDGSLFRALGTHVRGGMGIDPEAPDRDDDRFRYVRGYFPTRLDDPEPFDVAVALATLEHVPTADHERFATACFDSLRPGGRIVLTVPSPAVDPILHMLKRLRLGQAPGLHQHHGFETSQTRPMFEGAGFVLTLHRRFQLGLNNLFVFTRPENEVRAG
jgi:SAM-dependent methyltransferase